MMGGWGLRPWFLGSGGSVFAAARFSFITPKMMLCPEADRTALLLLHRSV
jgi:hypothetical protein